MTQPRHSPQDPVVPEVVFPLQQLKPPLNHLLSPAQEVGSIFSDHGETELQPLAGRHPAVFGNGFGAQHMNILAWL
jgi:hypothetical protein